MTAYFETGFDDNGWKRGSAPFGREELPFERKPNTVWTSSDIWLRRDFTLPPAPEAFWQCVQWQARSSVTGVSIL